MRSSPDRIQRNRISDSFATHFLLKEPVTPSLESAPDFPGRFQDKLDEPVFGLRGKKRSVLRDAVSLSGPFGDLSKSAFAIFRQYWEESLITEQFRYWKSLRQTSELPQSVKLPNVAAYNTWLSSEDGFFQQPLTLSESADALSQRSARFLSENCRTKYHSNLSNSV